MTGAKEHSRSTRWRAIPARPLAFFGIVSFAIVSALAVIGIAVGPPVRPALAARGIIAGVVLLVLSRYLSPSRFSSRWVFTAYCWMLGGLLVAGMIGRIALKTFSAVDAVVALAGIALMIASLLSGRIAKRAKQKRTRVV
jgi:hypothetical protein